ncbi:protein of unknown function [Sphingomonas laterariae]|uniref:DUF4893 domain-containing protein n=1 Tax=Edaphosphingomonas laterariae TaxID=861865 RepID=A0A239GP80_9SPHN|nr:DUF4893 domain-containing protein [Sphingomonas laterariae]SNS70940.1 protein of unknown function [Sphingomonas laterariae]
MTSKNPLLLLFLLAIGCTTTPPAEPPAAIGMVEPAPPVPTAWRDVATAEDAAGIETLPARWQQVLTAVKGWRQPAVSAEGELLDPHAALVRPLLPPGRYRCRTLRFEPGRYGGFQSFQPWFCFVAEEGDLTTLTKATGSDRPAGRLWPDDDRRLVFLGTTARGTDKAAPAYGDRRAADTVGVLERVADFQWRLVLLRQDDGLDVIELVPDVPPPAPTPPKLAS